ncbi:hypothetical protein HPU229334_02125, partial [Helicobacter pullorum]
SIEELDSKESQANKKDLDSINSKQSNIKESKEYKERLDSKESQVGKKDSESNFSSTLKVA